MTFSRVVSDGIDRIYSEDMNSQVTYLTAIAKHLRGREEISTLLKAKAFFVPNSQYMATYFGAECTNPEYDLYFFDECVWNNFLVFPIYNVADNVAGLAGWDVQKKLLGDDAKGAMLAKYKYSRSTVFNRGNYVYFLPGYFERAVKEGYAILTDGIFDMTYLVEEDLIAGSLLGSFLTDIVVFMLRFIDTLYIAYDNDSAGRELYEELKRKHPNVKYLRQNMMKDVDDILKTESREDYVTQVRLAIKQKKDLTFRTKPRFGVF